MSVVEPVDDTAGRGITLTLLSAAAGSMDAIAFLTLGRVFTSAMSGNTILFGIALGQGRLFAAFHAIAAFIGYVLGVAGATLPLRHRTRGIDRLLAIEILFLAGFAALWTSASGPKGGLAVYGLILLSAIGMGMQGAAGRHLRIPGIVTIVFTSTLTAIVGTVTERLLAALRPVVPAATARQIEAFLVYLASAIVTGFVVSRWLAWPQFLPLAAVLAAWVALKLERCRGAR